ncbi:hypothetical protein, partial [Allisonella histaminiformans]|uniref:hypothetical protein n=1 Tax=Allisonella histaminiformans TaxID=209880 RepID=UPI00307D4C59
MKGIRKILLASLLTLTMAGSVSAASLSGGMKGSEVSQLQQQLIDSLWKRWEFSPMMTSSRKT